MKKSTLFLAGMTALLLSFGLILTGCETDADDDSNAGGPSVKITGTARVGQTLTAVITGFDEASNLRYKWEETNEAGTLEGNEIGSDASYTIQAEDEGKYIRVMVSAGGRDDRVQIYSARVGPIQPATSDNGDPSGDGTRSVAITGTARVGQTLTAVITGFDGTSGLRYKWEETNEAGTFEGSSISDAASTYTIQAKDVGKYIRVRVSASTASGGRVQIYSAQPPIGPIVR